MSTRRPRRLALRSRIQASFALGALGMAVVLSLITYGLTRRSVVHARQTADIHQALANALVVHSALAGARPDVFGTIDSLSTPSSSQSVLWYQGHWFSTTLAEGEGSVPAALRHRVMAEHKAANQMFRLGDQPELAVGVPLGSVGANYFELFSFEDVRRTLGALALSLVAASVATSLAGLAVGRYASRRVLTPLTSTARAAAAIASGQLDTRLQSDEEGELADLAASFNSMVSALQQRIQRDARFASDVSHELRSPLTTLANAVAVLGHRRAELPERSAQALDLLSEEVRRFQGLVEDLLEVSRFDSGAVEVSLEELHPVELVRRALAAGGHTEVPVVVGPGLEDVTIRSDKRRLERILTNLVDNAELHGGGVVRVALDPVEGPPPALAINVDDAGPGVPADERQAVFERFYRGAAAGDRTRVGGVGLGLSLVLEHSRLIGGRVRVEDSPEGGARFVLELPLSGGPAPDAAEEAEEQSVPGNEVPVPHR
ncbi:MAG TPA: HAMP domain-containing sensor histidine kinase [Acidimicrobiales bacterium]|nr:HAMP domain-containing sensor histidine kinase [Acidimicrobiales bacterium]